MNLSIKSEEVIVLTGKIHVFVTGIMKTSKIYTYFIRINAVICAGKKSNKSGKTASF